MNFTLTEFLAIVSPVVSIAIGIGTSNAKIKMLEKTVDKHNKFAERMPALEAKVEALEENIKDLKGDK